MLLAGLLVSCHGDGSSGGERPTDSTSSLPPIDPGLSDDESPENRACNRDSLQDNEKGYQSLEPRQIDEGVFEATLQNADDQVFTVTFRGPPNAEVGEQMASTRVCLEAYEFTLPEAMEAQESVADIVVKITSQQSGKSTEDLASDRDGHTTPGPNDVTLAGLLSEYGVDEAAIVSDATDELSGLFSSSNEEIEQMVIDVLNSPGAPFIPSPGETIDGQLSAEEWAQMEGNLLVEVELIEAGDLKESGVAIGFAFDPAVHASLYPQRVHYEAKCQNPVRVILHRDAGRMQVRLWRVGPYSYIGDRTGSATNPDPPPLSSRPVKGHVFDTMVQGLKDHSWYELYGSWTEGVDTCQ